MDVVRTGSRSKKRPTIPNRRLPVNQKKLDEMYPWDSFWDYMLEDSELDDNSRTNMLWWREKKREASRLAAIRQEIPITRSVSTRFRVSSDFESEEDPLSKTMISKKDLDQYDAQIPQRTSGQEPPAKLVSQLRGLHPFMMESRNEEDSEEEDEDLEEYTEEEYLSGEDDVSIAESFVEGRNDQASHGIKANISNITTRYQSRDDDDEDDEEDMEPSTDPIQQAPSEGSSKWKKKWNPSNLLKKKGKAMTKKGPPKTSFHTRKGSDNGDDTTSSSSTPTTPTSSSLLVTHHMPISKRQSKKLDRKSSNKGWPLNTEDMTMSAESFYVRRVPPQNLFTSSRKGIQHEGFGSTSSNDEDVDRVLLETLKSSSSSRKKTTVAANQQRWSVSSQRRSTKVDQGAGPRNRPRLASLQKINCGRKAPRDDGLSDGDYDDEDRVALPIGEAWLDVENDVGANKNCIMDPTNLLRLQQQRARPQLGGGAETTAAVADVAEEPAKGKRRMKKGGLRISLYRSGSDDNGNDYDDDDEISIAESILQHGPARIFL